MKSFMAGLYWLRILRDGSTGQVKVAAARRQNATGSLKCHYIVFLLPDFPCSSYTTFFFLDRMNGSPRQSCHFDLEADLKGHNDTQLSEEPVFPRAKHCQSQHMFIWRCPARFLK